MNLCPKRARSPNTSRSNKPKVEEASQTKKKNIYKYGKNSGKWILASSTIANENVVRGTDTSTHASNILQNSNKNKEINTANINKSPSENQRLYPCNKTACYSQKLLQTKSNVPMHSKACLTSIQQTHDFNGNDRGYL